MDQQLVFTVKDVLGRERPVTRTYGDGSVDCPFCTYAIRIPSLTCANPWCVAHPQMPPSTARKIVDGAAYAEAERERRARDNMMAAERRETEMEEGRMRRGRDLDEAEKRGACQRCLAHHHATGSGKKFIRHLRRPCPRNR